MRWTLFGLILAALGAALALESNAARNWTRTGDVRATGPGRRPLGEVERHARAARNESPGRNSPASDEAAGDGRWSVRLLGADGQPAQGVIVRVPLPGPSRKLGRGGLDILTDRKGRVSVPAPEGDANLVITSGGRAWTVSHDDATWRASALLPATFHLVDGQTGRPLAGSLQAKKSPTPSHVWTHRKLNMEMLVLPERGYAPESGPSLWINDEVAHYATGVRITVPVRPEARIRIRVTRHDGTPTVTATVTHASMASLEPELVELPDDDEIPTEEEVEPEEPSWDEIDPEGITWNADTSTVDAGGLVTLRGVPFLQGERMRFLLQEEGRHAHIEVLLGRRNRPLELDVVLPRARNEPFWKFDECWTMSCGYGCGGPIRGRGTVRITVYHADGRPARDASVRLFGRRASGRTDRNGEIRFDKLPPGQHTASVRDAGFVYTEQEFEIRGENETLVEIFESEGRTAEVLVLDHRGDLVPYARLEIVSAPAPYALIRNGIQELLLHTDERGEATLPGLPAQELSIQATFGSRKIRGDLKNNRSRLVLELPPPE